MKTIHEAIEAAQKELLEEKSVPESRIYSEINIAKSIFDAPGKQGDALRACTNYESIKSAVKKAVNLVIFSLDQSFAKELFFEVRNGVCTLGFQWRAYAKLARLSGAAEDIRYTVVYKDEAAADGGNGFVYDPINRRVIKHTYIPIQSEAHQKSRGIYGVVASAVKKNGVQIDLFVELYRLDKRKSKAKTDYVWKEWDIEMYGKTAVKMLCNELFINIITPEHSEIARAIAEAPDYEEEYLEQAANREEYNQINKINRDNGEQRISTSSSSIEFISPF
jgi:hypothetical protein